jgi:hypothetical protein
MQESEDLLNWKAVDKSKISIFIMHPQWQHYTLYFQS